MKRSRAGKAEPDPSGFAPRGAADSGDRVLDLLEDRPRLGEQRLSRLGQFDPSWLAAEQLHLKLGFERPDLLAQRRLLDTQSRRRTRYMALLGDRDEVAEMAQFHMCIILITRLSYIGQTVWLAISCRPGLRREDEEAAMASEARFLMAQFLDWVDRRARRYAEVRDAWSSTCPLNCVWEDAIADDLVRFDGDGTLVLTGHGRARLDESTLASASRLA
jgi:hypothetical protein